MSFTLANVTPPPGLDAFLASAFYVVGLITAVVVLWQRLRTAPEQPVRLAPSPLEVKPAADYATRSDLERVDTAVHGRMKRERTEINEEMRRFQDSVGERIGNLDSKIDRNTELTAVTRGEVNLLNQHVARLSEVLTTFLQNQARATK